LDNVTPWVTGGGMWSWCLYTYGTYMYLSALNVNTIQRIDLTAGTPTLSSYISLGTGPASMAINGNYMYVAGFNGDNLTRIDLTNLTTTTLISGLGDAFGLAISGGYLYIIIV
jgi:hypothetical protein